MSLGRCSPMCRKRPMTLIILTWGKNIALLISIALVLNFGLEEKLNFDIHPPKWSLHLMSRMTFLRFILPHWHKKDRQLAKIIRREIVEQVPHLKKEERRVRLKTLENVKGYRDIRYRAFEESVI